MPMVNGATAGTATVELTILEQPEGNLERSSQIQIPGCFLKNDRNLQHFVEKFIDDSADRNKFDPGNSKYIFYSPVSDFRGVVTKAVLSYEEISKILKTQLQQKTKTCTVEKPLVITFDGHFFLCCDSEDLNESKFLKKYSKEVRINQTLDPSNIFYGLGMEKDYLVLIHFSLNEGQLQNDIYETNDGSVYNKLKEAGPLLLDDNKTIVGCYRKCNGKCSIKIKMFRKSEGAIEHQDQRVPFLYYHLRLATIRYLNDYIENGRSTLDELKYLFRVETEREEIDTVEKLIKALEDKGGIGANDVEISKNLAAMLECSGDVARSSTAIGLKTVLSVFGAGLVLTFVVLMCIYKKNPEKLVNLFANFGGLVALQRGSVVFVLNVSSVSSLKRLWQSYKEGSLKKKLKKSFNEMEELKELSQGEEIDVEVTIDEGEYREVLLDLILLEVKGRMHSSPNIKRRHSVCCERDVPKDKPMDVIGKSAKDTKSQRRHSTCCERDVPEDRSQSIDATQIQTQVGQPVTELEKPGKRIKHQRVRFSYDQLRLDTIRYLDDYIINGSDTLDDLKDRFHGFLSQLTENERGEINTVRKLVKALEVLGVIGANDVETLKMLAEKLELRELKEKVEEFEAECSGDDTRDSTAMNLGNLFSVVLRAGLVVGSAFLMHRYVLTNLEKLENLSDVFFDSLVPYLENWPF